MLNKSNRWFLAVLLAANLTLLLPAGQPLRVAGALLLIGLLPGWGWSRRLAPELGWLQITLAAGLSYGLAQLAALLLHYLPGPMFSWQLWLILNAIALGPLFLKQTDAAPARFNWREAAPLLLILLMALFLRVAYLDYSEFQGDEALAMIAAAEAQAGHADALFLRSKGPAEVLLPLAMWQFTGTITEATARLPFMLASLLAIITVYLIGKQLGGSRLGWLAAGFLAANGFMVAFGRIVQYQALVIWFSALAFLLALHWQQQRQLKFALFSGLSLGAGLLAHYDAVLALPAIGWLLLAPADKSALRRSFGALAVFAGALLLAALPFYLPFALNPQANRTGDYLGGRIGNELRNNLPDFFHFTTFYSSWYYLVVAGLLALAFLIWLPGRAGRWGQLLAAAAAIGIGAVVAAPTLLAVGPDLSGLPFAALLLAAFAALFFSRAQAKIDASAAGAAQWQALIGWLAVPFWGYNFVVALGLTHIYTTAPAWALLAARGGLLLPAARRTRFANLLAGALFLASSLFLWNAFARPQVEYRQNYPAANLPLFWTPYSTLPSAGFFGFPHRAGWKAVGQKIAAGELPGDYGSNEEPDITTWYTRGAPRACDPQPEYYFLASDLIDPAPIPTDLIHSRYQEIGRVTLPPQKTMQIWQQMPAGPTLGPLDDAALARQFDADATPTAFARSARGSQPASANFGNLIQLVGFDLDTRRAWPGGRLPVTLYWRALATIPANYQVFTHLETASGPAAQADGVPVCWALPTNAWRPGQLIADQHAIALPPEIKPGSYPLVIGLYLPDTFARLDMLDAAGNPAGNSLTLANIEIKNR